MRVHLHDAVERSRGDQLVAVPVHLHESVRDELAVEWVLLDADRDAVRQRDDHALHAAQRLAQRVRDALKPVAEVEQGPQFDDADTGGTVLAL